MLLTYVDIYVLSKKTFTAKTQCYVIDYCYFNNKQGKFEIAHSYIDADSYNSIECSASIDKNGCLVCSKPYKFLGHYEEYRFKADTLKVVA